MNAIASSHVLDTFSTNNKWIIKSIKLVLAAFFFIDFTVFTSTTSHWQVYLWPLGGSVDKTVWLQCLFVCFFCINGFQVDSVVWLTAPLPWALFFFHEEFHICLGWCLSETCDKACSKVCIYMVLFKSLLSHSISLRGLIYPTRAVLPSLWYDYGSR